MNNRLGRDTAGTADPNGPKEYSILYGITLNKKPGESWLGGSGLLPGDWVGIKQQVVSNHTDHHLFVYSFLVVIILPSSSVLLHCFYLKPRSLTFFSILFPIPLCGGKVSEQLCGV